VTSSDLETESASIGREADEFDRFRAILQHGLDLVAIFDRGGDVVWVSPSVERYTGRTTDEILRDGRLGIHPDDSAAAAARLAALGPGEETQPYEVRTTGPDGTERLLEVVTVNLLDAPNVRGYVATGRDVTERVRTVELLQSLNNALAESNEALAAIIETSPVAISTFDHDGTILMWNPACEAMTGWSSSDVIGGLAPTIHHEHVDAHMEMKRRVLAGDTVPVAEGIVVCKDGSLVEVQRAAAPLRDSAGEVVCGMIMTLDISALKNAERQLRAEERRLRALLENADDIIVLIDREANVLFVSPGVERILGYQGLAATIDLLALVHPDDQQAANEAFGRMRATPGAHSPIEVRLRHADGSWRDFEMSANNRLDDPAVGGVVLTARDISHQKESAALLAESEARYRNVVEDQTEMIARIDARSGLITFSNAAFDELYGDTSGDRSLLAVLDRVHDADRASLRAVGESLRERERTGAIEHRLRNHDGAWAWYRWIYRSFTDGDGDVFEVQIVGRNVTERKVAEMRVGDEARILEMIAQSALVEETLTELCRFVERSIPGSICLVHRPIDEGLGFDVVAASVTPGLARALGDPNIEPFVPWVEAALEGREVRGRLGDRPIEIELQQELDVAVVWSVPIFTSSEDRLVGVLTVLSKRDFDESPQTLRTIDAVAHLATIAFDRQAHMASMAYQAHHDPLTGLPNRALFLEVLTLALARIRRMRSASAVLFLDLDRFKVVNDSLGHGPGDQLLVTVAQRLQSVIRPGDVIARFGGDEFAVLCDLSGPEAEQQAVHVAERLIDVIHQPFALAGDEVFLGVSIGIALASTGDEKPEALLRDADAAMYRAKERGKGRWELFDEAMRSSAMRRLELENALHRAVDRREFRLFFQPVLDITNGTCVGAEGLVRWQHPERGLIPPGEFITLSEETGLITSIGAWVLDTACEQAALWLRARRGDEPFSVSVNLSARQLAQADLVDLVAQALERHSLTPSALTLEITESVLMEDAEWAIGSIRALRNLGVKLSIDDFGTGYSSLGYLKRFPVDTVKIDRSFVDGLGTDPEDSAIVNAVISLGHALGLQVVAEGVETEQQLAELNALGCDFAQGFLFAPPQPAPDVEQLVTRGRWRR
jgi:diguanylate cyclase (GGDEF)-like protein/PAS domain S-box-containing protein